MLNNLRPWHLLLASLAGWVNQHQHRGGPPIPWVAPAIDAEEADEWRRRVGAWRRFRLAVEIAGSNPVWRHGSAFTE